MATFMDVHSGFVGVTAQQLKEAHEKSVDPALFELLQKKGIAVD